MQIWTRLTDAIDGRVLVTIGVLSLFATVFVAVRRYLSAGNGSVGRIRRDLDRSTSQRRLTFVPEVREGRTVTRRTTPTKFPTRASTGPDHSLLTGCYT